MKSLKSLFVAVVALALAPAARAAAPAAPTGLTATRNDTEGIRLTWEAVDGAAYYVVYRYGGKTSQTGLVTETVTETTWYDTSCEAGFDIPYRVRAFNQSKTGGEYSSYANGYREPLLEPYHGGRCSVNPLANAGVAAAFKVKCNVKWTATADSWILLNGASFGPANDPQELGFSLAENTTGVPRAGAITIHAGSSSATLRVVQGAVKVDAADGWDGDAARNIVEDAAYPEEFSFSSAFAGGFASAFEVNAAGGSCLKSMAQAAGEKAVIAWTVPSDRALTFKWRKSSADSADVFTLWQGSFLADGTPDLANASKLRTCGSADWTEVSVGYSATAQEALFFVYEKKSSAAADCGYLDDFVFSTAPQELRFVSPAMTERSGVSILHLGCDGETNTIETVAVQRHTVTYGGEEHEVVRPVRIAPWQVVGANEVLGWEDDTATLGTRFYATQEVTKQTPVALYGAYYGPFGKTLFTGDLQIWVSPPIAGALDCDGLTLIQLDGWSWQSDYTASSGNSCVSADTPDAGQTEVFAVGFTANGILKFDYRRTAGTDETAHFEIDGVTIGDLPATDGAWQTVSVYVGEAGSHTLAWEFAKAAGGDDGGTTGTMSVDNVRFEALTTSLVVASEATPKAIAFADYAYAKGIFSVTALDGAWIDTSATASLADRVSTFGFACAQNLTGAARGDRLQVVCAAVTNVIRIVQGTTADATLYDLQIEQGSSIHLTSGEAMPFTATLGIGYGWTYGFADLDWTQSFGDAATLEGNVLTPGDVDGVLEGNVSVALGGVSDYILVTIHPDVNALAPDGITLNADQWRVEQLNADGDLGLQSQIQNTANGVAELAATVEGPGLLACEWKVSSEKDNDILTLVVDGRERERISGTDGDWAEVSIPLSEGAHEIVFRYAKNLSNDDGADSGYVRNFTFTPCTPTDETHLAGPANITSGGTGTWTFQRVYTNETAAIGIAAPVALADDATIELASEVDQTRAAAAVKVIDGEVQLKIPFSVYWNDTLTLTVNGASATVALTAASLADVLDNSLSGFDAPLVDGGEIEAVEDLSAEGGSCLRMASDSHWTTVALTLSVMDGGTVSYNYEMTDQGVSWTALFKVYVDDVEQKYLNAASSWTPDSVTVTGAGPHVIRWEFQPSDATDVSEALLDNVQWTADGEQSTTATGGLLDGNATVEGTSATYTYRLLADVTEGSETKQEAFVLAPQFWDLEFVSGDAEAVSPSYNGSEAMLWVSDTVTEETVVRIRAYNTVGSVNADASFEVTVPCREPVETALFDTALYENCWLQDGYGWNGLYGASTAGETSARSETPSEGEAKELHVVAYGAGTLSFDWKVSSDAGDTLQFLTNGVEAVTAISGTDGGWQHVSVTFADALDEKGETPLTREFTWVYQNNGDGRTAGDDCAWVDNLVWTGTTPTPVDRADVDIPTSLTPGSTVVAKIDFYRMLRPSAKGNNPGQDDGDDRTPATDDPLPLVQWNVINFSSSELESAVTSYIDDEQHLVLSLPEGCTKTGTFEVYAFYNMADETQWTQETVYVGDGPVVTMSKAMTASGVPLVWLAQRVKTVSATPATASALAASESKLAANGVNTLRECYVAGLDPENKQAAFTASVTVSNGVPVIQWSPNLPGREYILWGKTNLTDSAWVTPTNSAHHFFKVEIKTE